MLAAESGTTFVRVEKRFGLEEARRLRATLKLLAPVRRVSIDFSAAQQIDDASLSEVAQMLADDPGCRFDLEGLTHHRRRLLRYMGVADRPEPRETSRAS